MDIEGAEYDVLKKMIKDKSIDYIKMAFIEFHWNRMNMDEKTHFSLLSDLQKISKLKLMPELNFCLKKGIIKRRKK